MAKNDDTSLEYPQRRRLRLACRGLRHALDLGMSFSGWMTLALLVLPLTQLPEDKLEEELGDPMLDSLVEDLSRIGRGDSPLA